MPTSRLRRDRFIVFVAMGAITVGGPWEGHGQCFSVRGLFGVYAYPPTLSS